MEATANPFDLISQKLDTVLTELAVLKSARTEVEPTRIPFNKFCKEHGISRVTGYAWRDRGLIRLEKIGARQFVVRD